MELFENSNLLPEVQQAIKEMGFERPTEIQSQAIPFLLANKRDLIALAQTGTGKTAAFGLPIISQIDLNNAIPQALIICPTRELCLQIERDLKNFGKYVPLYTLAVYGGASITDQLSSLRRGVHIIVATPGRLVDIINRGKVNLSQVSYLVLDESDEMLNMGFQEDIDTILEQTPENKQTLLFSATMPQEVRRIANNYMINPEEITIGTKNSGAETISHHAYIVHSKDRYIALKRLADYYPDIYGIVFCRTRQETKDIADKLMSDGYNADALHGDLSQAQRDYVMKKFRNKNLQILVATDVAARGLDVQNLSHVINFSIPDDIETYTHRSGRTGRAGKEGISIAILNLKEKGKLRQIERLIKKTFELKQVPGGKEICNIKILNLIDKIKSVEVNDEKIGSFMGSITNAFADMSKEEIIQHFVSYEFNRILEYYENAPDINVDSSRDGGRERDRDGRNRRDRDRGERSERGDRSERDRSFRNDSPREDRRDRGERRDREDRGERTERTDRGERRERRYDDVDRSNFTRFFINIGKKEDLDKSKMLKLLNEHANDRDIQYGAIDILKSFSFFEVDAKYTSKILSSFAQASYEGRPISVEVAQAPTGKAARGSKNDFIKGESFTSKYSRSDSDRRDRGGSDRRDRSNSYDRGFNSSGRRNKSSDGGGRKRY
ncbi:MAG TPA: DEAD/DEAH box helicase [Bacteroidales bacterium]|nr:DEAD/DEAH box helicase [Bacteroidales bacterium]HPM12333.1 DEAD/DEAH box helicase [Bacteroidales bacterium]